MKNIFKHIIMLLVGLVLTGISLVDMLREEDDELTRIGDAQDNTSFFYLILGVILLTAGIIGVAKEVNKNPRRRY